MPTPESGPSAEGDDPATSELVIQGKRLGDLLESLREGGPNVDEPSLLAYALDRLDDSSRRNVEQLIVTWRQWNQAYWKLRMELILADLADDSPGSPPQSGAVDA